jgi:hypothetical protein
MAITAVDVSLDLGEKVAPALFWRIVDATQFLLIGLALLTDTLLRSICVFEQSREAAPRRRLRLLGGDSETNRNCRAAPGPVTSGESGTKPAPNRNMVSASDGAPDIVDHMGLRSSRSSWPISEY